MTCFLHTFLFQICQKQVMHHSHLIYFKIMRLCHPPDGSTSPVYKLLCFITTKKICKEKNALAFTRDRCCHLVICLRLIPFHSIEHFSNFTHYQIIKEKNDALYFIFYRTFTKYVFVPNRLFHLSLMFVGEARSLMQSGAPERHFPQVSSRLTRMHYNMLEMFATSKHSSLLRT